MGFLQPKDPRRPSPRPVLCKLWIPIGDCGIDDAENGEVCYTLEENETALRSSTLTRDTNQSDGFGWTSAFSKSALVSGLISDQGSTLSTSSNAAVEMEDAEVQAISELRLRLREEAGLHDLPDDLLHCCCRVAGGNKSLAFQRARDMFEWRAQEGVDGIMTDPAALAAEKFWRPLLHYGLPGLDRKFRPVMIQAMGRWDMKALRMATRDRKSGLIRAHLLLYETLRRQAQEALLLRPAPEPLAGGGCGKRRLRPVRWVLVLDVGGLSLWHTRYPEVLSCLKEVGRTVSRYYPESVDRMFVVNASSSFHAIWRIISHLFKPNTRAKVRVLPEGDFRELLAECGSVCIPEHLGGRLPASMLPDVAA